VVFGKDAYLDCWNNLRTLSMKQQLGVFMTLEQQGKAVGTPDEVTALRVALVKRRETLVSRRWWKLYKDTVDATAYVPDAEDLEDIRCTIFAELAVILQWTPIWIRRGKGLVHKVFTLGLNRLFFLPGLKISTRGRRRMRLKRWRSR